MIAISFQFYEPNGSAPIASTDGGWPAVPREGEEIKFSDLEGVESDAWWEVVRVRWRVEARDIIADVTLWRAAWQRKAPVTTAPEAEDVQRTTE